MTDEPVRPEMSGYAPTTDEVRLAWWMTPDNTAETRASSDLSFDAWLAAHDAEVTAKALEEASWAYMTDTHNPAQVRDMLRARAAQIREGK